MNQPPLSSRASYEGPDPTAAPASVPRMGRTEFNRRLQSASPFRYRPPTDAELDDLVGAYEAIVGRRASRAVMNLLATCWRVHGIGTVRRLHELHAELGTTTNLLAELRLREPSTFAASAKEGDSHDA